MNTKVALSAIDLLGQWNRISQVHLALGSGCMCAGAMPGLAVSDLEINIFEFLEEKYGQEKEFTDWLAQVTQKRRDLSGIVADLLKNIVTKPPSSALATKVLKDLKNTISSLNDSHKG